LELVPKLGANIEKRILRKLAQKSRGKTLGDFTANDGNQLFYYNAPQYGIHVHTEDYVPKIEYYERYEENPEKTEKVLIGLRKTNISSHYKPIIFDHNDLHVANAVLNSSLFYWWFIVWSNGRDLLLQQITSFPIDLNDFPDTLKTKLNSLVEQLMKSYDETSNKKINSRDNGNIIRIKEILPKFSKKLIDQIDDVLAGYYDFSEKESDFIKGFDLGFRM
jgi:hypothetical protein